MKTRPSHKSVLMFQFDGKLEWSTKTLCGNWCLDQLQFVLFDSLYWCVSDCIRTANGAMFLFDIAHCSFMIQFIMSKDKQSFQLEGYTVIGLLLQQRMFVKCEV